MKDIKVRVQCEGDIERVIEHCRQSIPVQVISSVEMFNLTVAMIKKEFRKPKMKQRRKML